MDTPEENPKPFSPIKAICVGVLFFGLAGYYLWTGVVGVMSGAITAIAKAGAHHLIFRQDRPDEFWFWIVAHFIVAVIGFTGAVILFVDGVRRIRR